MARYTPETGYKEAQRRIQEALEETTVSLDLGWLELTAVPPEIGQLTALTTLDLNRNQLTVVPPEIGLLTALRSLYLDVNRLTAVPPEIEMLTALQSLTLRSNKLTAVLPEIGQLTALQSLHLSDNELTAVPPEIRQLTALQLLNLGNNWLTAVPPEIRQLTALQSLKLYGNELTSVPPEIGQLTALEALYLSSNKLTSVPPEIGRLTALEALYLHQNQLTAVPSGIKQLTKLQKLWIYDNQLTVFPEWLAQMPQLEKLQIQQNPITQPPPEVLGEALTADVSEDAHVNLEAIRRYYAQLAKEGEAYFYEAKLLLIGEGGAGKTSLARKLLSPTATLPSKNESTEGIDIYQWQFDIPSPPHLPLSPAPLLPRPPRYTANIWDFGGQSVYHATHQFFLSNRAVYILLTDTRRENDRFYDWLQMQEAFGGNSPVLLLKNQNRQHGSQCVIENLPHLRERYPNLVDEIVEVDLSRVPNDPRWDDLLRYLQRYLLNLEHIGQPFPKTWVAVRNALKTDGRNSISSKQYLTLCRQHGIDDEANALQLSQFLHDIGDILHYQQDNGELRDLIILNSEWALAAVYRVLDDEQINNRWGQFSYNDLRQLWHEDEYDGHTSQLLALMQTFQLCYPLPNQPHDYIAPQLLTPDTPAHNWQSHPDDLQLRFHYPRFMPRGILGRTIAKLHDKIEAQDTVWRSGVILANGHARAKLLELRGEKEIRISVSGNRRRDFLMEIVNTIDSLHDGFSNKLEYEKRVPCRCEQCQQTGDGQHFFSMELLLKYRDKGIPTIRCDESLDEVNTHTLIDDSLLYMDRRGGDIHTHHHYGDHIEGDKVDGDKLDGDKYAIDNITDSNVAIGDQSRATTT